jgi:hypothetical protein
VNARRIRSSLRGDRILMCTLRTCRQGLQPRQRCAGAQELAIELTDPAKLQADLFLRPNEDGLFPGFTQTWRAEG